MATKTEKCRETLDRMSDRFTAAELGAVADVSPALVNNVLNKEIARGTLRKVKKGRRTEFEKVEGIEFSKKSSTIDLDVNKRFDFIFEFTQMVGSQQIPSLLLTGNPGTGKSYTVIQALSGLMLEEGIDYTVVKGHSSPFGLYELLYNNQEGLLLFDDCDSCWDDKVSLNLLKGALDSYAKRTISWYSSSTDRGGLPSSFDFKGSIIFISNRRVSKLDPAVVSRTITANLELTNMELIDRMEGIIEDVEHNVATSKKQEVIDFLRENADKFKELSLRTFLQGTRLRNSSENWRDMILFTLTS
jgi:hypothetical protein